MKILIIDNDQDTAITLQALLEGENNLSIDVASGADEAWLRMQQAIEPYSLAMLDIMMPGESGIDLAGRMSKDANLQNIPVILMSSALPLPPKEFLEFLHRDNSMSVVRGVLEKPFTSEDLLSKIKEVLG